VNEQSKAAPDLDRATSSRLLKMAVSGPRRPIDDLIARLERSDGEAWLRAAFRSSPFVDERIDQGTLTGGGATVEQLVRLKERSKKLVTPGADEDTRLRGLLGYFVSIAAAVAQHGQFISAKSPDDVRAALTDLAGVIPGPVAEILARASFPER
jgi:hypothetical protein